MGGGATTLPSIKIYTHSNASTESPKYLHFLDSDDYLSLDCISECVKLATQFDAEIVWHNHNLYFQESQKTQTASFLRGLNLQEKCLYRGIDIFKSLPKPLSFSWVAMGIIDYEFLTKHHLSFQKGIESEDALFGMKLFSLAQKVIITYLEGYTYRIRPHSISAHTLTKETKEMKFPESLQDLVQTFSTPYEVRHYSFAYSHCVICLELDAFIQSHYLDEEVKETLKEMITYRAIYAFGALSFKSDPRNCREMCKKLLPYSSQVRLSSKLAYYFPRVFKMLKEIQRKMKGR